MVAGAPIRGGTAPKTHTVHTASALSPADILRSRMSASPAHLPERSPQSGALHAGGQPRQADMSGNAQPEYRRRENATKENPDKGTFSGEVSNELLRSVL